MKSARCIGCGCDDNHACQPYGCSWLRVDYAAGVGVCSECRALVAEWDQGRRDGIPDLTTPMRGGVVRYARVALMGDDSIDYWVEMTESEIRASHPLWESGAIIKLTRDESGKTHAEVVRGNDE